MSRQYWWFALFITVLFICRPASGIEDEALIGIDLSLDFITTAYFKERTPVVVSSIRGSTEYVGLFHDHFNHDPARVKQRVLGDSESAHRMFTKVLRDARSQASRQAGKAMRIGQVSYPIGIDARLSSAIVDAIGEVEPSDEVLPPVVDSRRAAHMTVPDNHCFLEVNETGPDLHEDERFADHTLGIEILGGRTLVSVSDITQHGPLIPFTSQKVIHAHGHKLVQTVAQLTKHLNNPFLAVVISGNVTVAEAKSIEALLVLAFPSLVDRVKLPSSSFRDVSGIGAACLALNKIVNAQWLVHPMVPQQADDSPWFQSLDGKDE